MARTRYSKKGLIFSTGKIAIDPQILTKLPETRNAIAAPRVALLSLAQPDSWIQKQAQIIPADSLYIIKGFYPETNYGMAFICHKESRGWALKGRYYRIQTYLFNRKQYFSAG